MILILLFLLFVTADYFNYTVRYGKSVLDSFDIPCYEPCIRGDIIILDFNITEQSRFLKKNKTKQNKKMAALLINIISFKNYMLGHGYRFRARFSCIDEMESDRNLLREFHGGNASIADILSDPLSKYPLTLDEIDMLSSGVHPLGYKIDKKIKIKQ